MYTIINIPIVVTTCIVYCRYHLSSYKARPVYIKLPPSLINAGRRQWSWLPRITCMEGRELKSQTRWSPPRKGHEKHIIAAVGSPLPKKTSHNILQRGWYIVLDGHRHCLIRFSCGWMSPLEAPHAIPISFLSAVQGSGPLTAPKRTRRVIRSNQY